jgi:Kef-type K+ transport system membrane component KefB
LIGPGFGWVHETEHLDFLSETGVILLLFLVGIELNIRHFKAAGKEVLWTGSIQMVSTFLFIYSVIFLLGYANQTAWILGLTFMFSSTVVVVKLLQEHRESKAFHGRIAIGILLLQDVAALAAITWISSMSPSGEGSGGSSWLILTKAVTGMGTLILTAWLASKFLINPALNWSLPIPGMMFIWSLAWCFLFVSLAHVFGLSHEIGAFLAGLSLAQSQYNMELKRRVHPLMNFFVVIFFVLLGAKIKLDLSVTMWVHVFMLSVLVMILKFAVVGGTLWAMGRRSEGTLLSGLHLAQISEFSLILIALAARQELVSPEIQTLVAWTGIITIAVSSYAILFRKQLLRWWRHSKSCSQYFEWKQRDDESREESPLESSAILVIGMNAMGRDIVTRLVASGEKVTAIDSDPNKLKGLKCRTIHGNIHDWDLLEAAGFEHATMIVSALQIEEANQLLAFRAQQANIPCCVMTPDTHAIPALLDLGVSYFMTPFADGIKRQRAELVERGLLKS